MAHVRIAHRFRDDLNMVYSEQVLLNILNTVQLLETIPTLGSTAVPESILHEFGQAVHKIPVNPFDLITIYHAETDTVDVLGLIHQKAAW